MLAAIIELVAAAEADEAASIADIEAEAAIDEEVASEALDDIADGVVVVGVVVTVVVDVIGALPSWCKRRTRRPQPA